MKIIIFLFSFLLLAFSPDTYGQDCEDTVEGYLQLFGTDYFPEVAIITEDHGRLFLDLPPEKQEELWKNRKSRLRMTGKIFKDKWRGNLQDFITPEKWEWIEKPK